MLVTTHNHGDRRRMSPEEWRLEHPSKINLESSTSKPYSIPPDDRVGGELETLVNILWGVTIVGGGAGKGWGMLAGTRAERRHSAASRRSATESAQV